MEIDLNKILYIFHQVQNSDICNWKRNLRLQFKYWTRLFKFHMAQKPLERNESFNSSTSYKKNNKIIRQPVKEKENSEFQPSLISYLMDKMFFLQFVLEHGLYKTISRTIFANSLTDYWKMYVSPFHTFMG